VPIAPITIHCSAFSSSGCPLTPAVCMNRQPGHQRPRNEGHKPSHNRVCVCVCVCVSTCTQLAGDCYLPVRRHVRPFPVLLRSVYLRFPPPLMTAYPVITPTHTHKNTHALSLCTVSPVNKSPAVARVSRPYSWCTLATCVHNCPSMMFRTCCCLRPKCERSYLLIYITSDTS